MIKSEIFDRDVPKAGCLSFTTITDSFRSNWHSHPEYEIAYIKKGNGTIQYGNELFEYQQGDLLLLGPWIPHEFKENSRSHESITFLITEHFLSIDLFTCDITYKIKQLLTHSIFGLCFSLSDQLQISINTIHQKSGIEQAIELLALLKKLSQHEYHQIQNQVSSNKINHRFYKKYVQLQKILAYINIHITDKITLQMIADKFYVSKSYLSQLFNEFIQTTFTHYLLNQRLYYACRLLATSNQSITEIAEQSGFSSLSSFNRQFLKIKQTSPRDYRKKQLTINT